MLPRLLFLLIRTQFPVDLTAIQCREQLCQLRGKHTALKAQEQFGEDLFGRTPKGNRNSGDRHILSLPSNASRSVTMVKVRSHGDLLPC